MLVQRGPGGGAWARAQLDDKHRMRWSIARFMLGGNVATDPAEMKCVRRSMGFKNKDGAFMAASDMLIGTNAQGEPDAIRNSYELVENEIRMGNAARFSLGDISSK